MNFVVFMLCVFAILILFFVATNAIFFLWLRRIWRRTRPDQSVRRSLIVAFGLGAIVSLFVGMKIWERNFVLARVPKPLEVAEIEYRLEESWGVGFMPGDNETGFVVYRLTDTSADWARKQGNQLKDMLSVRQGAWHATPVDDRGDERALDMWHPYDDDPEMMSVEHPARHPPTISEYLGKYGFDISIKDGRDGEADKAIQSTGSFYSYGPGGSITIVDPSRGKVFFAYAG